jgi:rhodanese-related sulfurtransferase
MKNMLNMAIKAFLIVIIGSLIGLGMNFVSSSPIPWIYEPPRQIELSGVKVTLVDERQAGDYFSDASTVFVDTRSEEDFRSGRVKGALHIHSEKMERQYPMVAALMPEDSRIVLYCHGPECDMAEKVASFLAQLGYENMMVMTSGYPAWEEAGYPVEKGPPAP